MFLVVVFVVVGVVWDILRWCVLKVTLVVVCLEIINLKVYIGMAAGPADAFSATPRGFGCYDRELISAAADNLWSSSVVATASTGASWVDEVHNNSDPIEKRIEDIKRKFHRGRILQIKHLPREITEEVSYFFVFYIWNANFINVVGSRLRAVNSRRCKQRLILRNTDVSNQSVSTWQIYNKHLFVA